MTRTLSRRAFTRTAIAAACAQLLSRVSAAEPIIDIHQHTHYWPNRGNGQADESRVGARRHHARPT